MPVTTTQHIKCDHVHEQGNQCLASRNVPDIDVLEPFYHIVVRVDVVDANGAHEVMNKDVYTCRWCLYYELTAGHDEAMVDLKERQATAEAARLEVLPSWEDQPTVN